jgi:hypothetical protein
LIYARIAFRLNRTRNFRLSGPREMMRNADARMSSLLVSLALLLAWMVLPLVVMLLLQLPEWIYAEGDHGTPFFWKHIDIIVALGWAVLFLLLALWSPDFHPRERLKHGDFRSLGAAACFMLFFSWVAGGSIGGLAFGLVNCALDRSEGEETKIKDVKK